MKHFIVLALAVVFVVVAVSAYEDEEYNAFSKFEAFIKKYGHKALEFLKCMGPTFVEHCSEQTLHCLATHDVVGCISLIKCEGKDAKNCAHHL